MTTTEIIRYLEGTTTDATEIVTSAKFLESIGWDFTEDYQNWKDGKYSGQPYTKEELQSYESFLNVSDVVIHLKESGNTYFGMKHINYANSIECNIPTGDDEQTLIDISENLDKFTRL